MSNIHCAIGNLQYTYGMKRLGALIRSARDHAGLRGYELAARISKQPSYVTRLETGEMKTLPSPEELAAIGEALDLPMPVMLAAAGYALDDEPADDDPVEAVIAELRPAMREVRWDRNRIAFLESTLRHFRDVDCQQSQSALQADAAPDPPAPTPGETRSR